MSAGTLGRQANRKRSHRNRRSPQQARHHRVAARCAREGRWDIGGVVHGPRAQQSQREEQEQPYE